MSDADPDRTGSAATSVAAPGSSGCAVDEEAGVPPRHPDHGLLCELEPVAERLLDRRLSMAREWMPYDGRRTWMQAAGGEVQGAVLTYRGVSIRLPSSSRTTALTSTVHRSILAALAGQQSGVLISCDHDAIAAVAERSMARANGSAVHDTSGS
jgi:hypothetical protein